MILKAVKLAVMLAFLVFYKGKNLRNNLAYINYTALIWVSKYRTMVPCFEV